MFFAKNKISWLWGVFITSLSLLLWSWPGLALAAHDQYMPQQEELPGGFKLTGFLEENHPWYGETALQGEWEIKGTVYHFNWDDVPGSSAHQIETMGWMSQHDVEANLVIKVIIGENTSIFTTAMNNLADGGVGDLPGNNILLAKGKSISLNAGEDEAVRFEGGLPGYCFSKGGIGVIVAPGGNCGADPWVLEKLGGNPRDLDKVLFAMAQSIAQSIPAQGQASGGAAGAGNSSGSQGKPPLASATILLATALSGLVLTGGALINMVVNRPAVSGGGAVQPITPGAPRSGEERNGQVWYKPPWDQGGPRWISKAEYTQIQNMSAQGKVWSDRWGWADPDQLQQNELSRARNWADFTRQDQTARVAAEAVSQAHQGYNLTLQNLFKNQQRYNIEINQIYNLRQARIDASEAARWEKICNTAEAVSWTADTAMNILGKVVPGGGYISDGYTVLRGAAEGVGNAVAEGGHYTRHVIKGTAQGAWELAMDKGQEGVLAAIKRNGSYDQINTKKLKESAVEILKKVSKK